MSRCRAFSLLNKTNGILGVKCFLERLQKKGYYYIYRRNKKEKKQKMCANPENTWLLDCTKKSTKKKKKDLHYCLGLDILREL